MVYALRPIVGLLAGLRGGGRLTVPVLCSRGLLCRCLLLRLVLQDLRKAFRDVALFLLFLCLADEQLPQLRHLLQQRIHLAVGICELLQGLVELPLKAGHQLTEHQDNLVLIHTAKVMKKDEITKKNNNYF